MTADADRALRRAALGFACATAFTTAVAIREDLPGEPFGIRVPLSVPAGILVGWGAAVAAPWPMPAAALVATRRLGDPNHSPRAALVCAGLGVAGVIGLLIEPNTYRPQAWTPASRVAMAAHLAASGALAAVGFTHWTRSRAGARR